MLQVCVMIIVFIQRSIDQVNNGGGGLFKKIFFLSYRSVTLIFKNSLKNHETSYNLSKTNQGNERILFINELA